MSVNFMLLTVHYNMLKAYSRHFRTLHRTSKVVSLSLDN